MLTRCVTAPRTRGARGLNQLAAEARCVFSPSVFQSLFRRINRRLTTYLNSSPYVYIHNRPRESVFSPWCVQAHLTVKRRTEVYILTQTQASGERTVELLDLTDFCSQQASCGVYTDFHDQASEVNSFMTYRETWIFIYKHGCLEQPAERLTIPD